MTVMRLKMRRPSGAWATPMPATTCAGLSLMSLPLRLIVPVRGFSRPEIVCSVVVLPAPFEPIRVTISPWSTWSVTPFSAWMLP